MKPTKKKHNDLVVSIKKLVEQARENVIQNINVELLYTYWSVGKLLVAKERHEKYDEVSLRQMLIDLSQQLTTSLGKGFSRSQLTYMRVFYLRFRHFPVARLKKRRGLTLSNHLPKKRLKTTGLTVSNQLSWSHYHELLKCNKEDEISFYGIILTKHKDDITVEYAIKGISNKIFVSKYQLYLPDKKMLQQRVEGLLTSRLLPGTAKGRSAGRRK